MADTPDEPIDVRVAPPVDGVEELPEGGARLTLPGDDKGGPTTAGDHFENLLPSLDAAVAQRLETELADLIRMDKEAAEKSDKQYAESLDRTGLTGTAPGGASFAGASKVAHPMIIEAAVDFASRVSQEILPPEGPAKDYVLGDKTKEKVERAHRVARLMNWQLTEQIPNFAHEMEQGLTQCPIGGAFYMRAWYDEVAERPDVMFVPADQVWRPAADCDFYSCDRVTCSETVTETVWQQRVSKGVYYERDDAASSPPSSAPEETRTQTVAAKVSGDEAPAINRDGLRPIWTSSWVTSLDEDDEKPLPYIFIMDGSTQKLVAVYRNWAKDDDKKTRIDLLIEFPFWPWRGGRPIGISHMINGLSAAATGALRALLDSAHQQNAMSGYRLKGAATTGGQNVRPRPGEITEIAGSLASDDIRKTLMMPVFNGPSPVLFQLLGFLQDAARGVVRTTFDDMKEMGNGQMPVGTTQAIIEQGLKNFSAIHARMHRSMRRLLRLLYVINSMTIDTRTIADAFGEVEVTREDFTGPMCVSPVSDPRLFSDLQRMAQVQAIAQRAEKLPALYDLRKVETMLLERMRVPDAEDLLVKPVTPKEDNPVNENVGMMFGKPVMAFPDQDHVSHMTVHTTFMEAPEFGQNPTMAMQFLPAAIAHLKEHMVLWYAHTTMTTVDEHLNGVGASESIVDMMAPENADVIAKALAEASPLVLANDAPEALKAVMKAIMGATQLLQSMAPKPPPDPATEVLMLDQKRRAMEAQTRAQIDAKKIEIAQARDQAAAVSTNAKLMGDAAKVDADRERAREKDESDRKLEIARLTVEAARLDQEARLKAEQMQVDQESAELDNASREAIAQLNAASREATNTADNEVALHIMEREIETGEKVAVSTGTGVNPGAR